MANAQRQCCAASCRSDNSQPLCCVRHCATRKDMSRRTDFAVPRSCRTRRSNGRANAADAAATGPAPMKCMQPPTMLRACAHSHVQPSLQALGHLATASRPHRHISSKAAHLHIRKSMCRLLLTPTEPAWELCALLITSAISGLIVRYTYANGGAGSLRGADTE